MYKQMDLLLNQKELELLDKIDAAVTKRYPLNEVHTEVDENGSRNGQFMEKVSVMEKNLKAIMERMSEQNSSKELFLENYAEWRKNRVKCIDKLKRIAKSLRGDRFMANMMKLCGLCLSVGGGIAMIASGTMLECPESALIVGGAVSATGTAVALGASITESVRLARKIKKARRLIEKDKAYFQGIQEWLNHAEELQEALFGVLEIDILKGIRADIKKFVHKAMKIKDEFKRLRLIEKKANSIISAFGEDTDVPITVIVMIPRIFITAVLLLCKTENRLVCDFASVTFKSVVVVGLLVENSLQAVGLASKLGLSSVQILTLATGLVGITLDAVTIVRTCVDIHRKSRSPEAKRILTAVTNYAEEVEVLDNLYEILSEKKNSVAATSDTEEVKIRNNPFEGLSQPKEDVDSRFQHFDANAGNRFQHFETDVGNRFQLLSQPKEDVNNQFQHFEADVGNPFQILSQPTEDIDYQFQHFEPDVTSRFQHFETDVGNRFQLLSQPKEDVGNRFQQKVVGNRYENW